MLCVQWAVAENRRASSRHDVHLPAQVTVDGTTLQYVVINVSHGGALIGVDPNHQTADAKLAMNTRVVIRFEIPTFDEPIEVGATVRWSDRGVSGIHFDGLRARDVWALNKFFEQPAP